MLLSRINSKEKHIIYERQMLYKIKEKRLVIQIFISFLFYRWLMLERNLNCNWMKE